MGMNLWVVANTEGELIMDNKTKFLQEQISKLEGKINQYIMVLEVQEKLLG